LYRVIKRLDAGQKTFTGLTMTEVEKAKKKAHDVEYYDFEYDVYL
jgi:hypothetical protein